MFGQVLALLAGDDGAVAIANDTPYGLSGALWSGDRDRASEVAARIRTGQVVLNGAAQNRTRQVVLNGAAQNLAAPSGGVGASGFGRENSRFGIEAFLDHQNLQGAA